MLKSLLIENFKAFGEPAQVDLAPITLIYGQNSAGKSSVLQALNLLKQTHESRESGASLLPRAEDGIVDLGSFKELLFDHDTRRILRIGMEVDSADARQWHGLRRALPNADRAPVSLVFGFGHNESTMDVTLQELRVAVGSMNSPFASFGTRPLTDYEQREMYRLALSALRGQRPGRRQRIFGAECKWVTESAEFWDPVYRAWSSRREDIKTTLSRIRGDWVMRWKQNQEALLDETSPDQDRQMQESFDETVRFYSQPFDLIQFVHRMTGGWKGAVLGLNGFLPMTARVAGRVRLPELDLTESLYRGTLPRTQSLPTNDVASISFFAGRIIEDALDSLFPMGPFRRPPERWYIFTGTSPEDVGYKGDHLPDLLFRQPELVGHANSWLAKLEIGYQLRVRPVSDRESDLFAVRLVDTRRSREVEVGLSDVGFGISQILPFLVQSLASDNQIISIEQPEVHIHPRLQADLGGLLAECIRPPFSHQFLIETHSEHLVLRLQKLIRERRLEPSDVAVVYVERGPTGSRSQRLRLDERGEFIDEWPGGFFPERLRELL
jgi:hypothetical protein